LGSGTQHRISSTQRSKREGEKLKKLYVEESENYIYRARLCCAFVKKKLEGKEKRVPAFKKFVKRQSV